MNEEELRAELERVKAENEALKKRGQRGGSTMLKVSEKGGVSVYGLGRYRPFVLLHSTLRRVHRRNVRSLCAATWSQRRPQ